MQSERLPLLSALGLCAKARALITGVPMICEALSGKKAPYVVVSASDNGKNSQKKLADKCGFYGILLLDAGVTGEALAHAVGKTGHLGAVAVTDQNLAQLVISKANHPTP